MTSIAGLSISGASPAITIKDIDAIPDSARLLCPLIIPDPNGAVSNAASSRASTGGGGSGLLDLSYVLNYIYLHCEARSGINNFSAYQSLYSNVALIIKTILQNDNITGAVDMELNSIGTPVEIPDPAGNKFLGITFSLKVKEFAQ